MTLAQTPERPRSRRDPGAPSPTGDRPKALLFCPCGREASVDAWRTEREGRRRCLVCPDCGETLTVR